MLNLKFIEMMFENLENNVDDVDVFLFQNFDEWCEHMLRGYNKNDDPEYFDEIDELKNTYGCNNENTIVLMENCDDDTYLILKFDENDSHVIHTENTSILDVDGKMAYKYLFDILNYAICE